MPYNSSYLIRENISMFFQYPARILPVSSQDIIGFLAGYCQLDSTSFGFGQYPLRKKTAEDAIKHEAITYL
jgi:hypothetical protein